MHFKQRSGRARARYEGRKQQDAEEERIQLAEVKEKGSENANMLDEIVAKGIEIMIIIMIVFQCQTMAHKEAKIWQAVDFSTGHE